MRSNINHSVDDGRRGEDAVFHVVSGQDLWVRSEGEDGNLAGARSSE